MGNLKGESIRTLWLSALLGASLLNSTPAVAARPPTTVEVVNGSNRPVPVVAQGTTTIAGTVTIGNTPSVTVTGTPSVTLSGTPTVSLASGGNISVGNTVLVKDSDNPARNGLTLVGSANNFEFGGIQALGTVPGFTVPAGHRLVIEGLYAAVTIDHGKGFTATLIWGPSSMTYGISLSCTRTRQVNSTTPVLVDQYVCNQPVRLYADSGSAIYFDIEADDLSGAAPPAVIDGSVTISGYLISMP